MKPFINRSDQRTYFCVSDYPEFRKAILETASTLFSFISDHLEPTACSAGMILLLGAGAKKASKEARTARATVPKTSGFT